MDTKGKIVKLKLNTPPKRTSAINRSMGQQIMDNVDESKEQINKQNKEDLYNEDVIDKDEKLDNGKDEKRKQLNLNSIEPEQNFELLVNSVIDEVKNERFNDIDWWSSMPLRKKFRPGDIVFNNEYERFGIFLAPALKENLIKVFLFKKNTKFAVYNREWYIGFDETFLVKRRKSEKIMKGFIDTPQEFIEHHDRVKERIKQMVE